MEIREDARLRWEPGKRETEIIDDLLTLEGKREEQDHSGASVFFYIYL